MDKRKFMFALLCCLPFLFITGCWGSREPDELNYILAMGLDKGEHNVLKVTMQEAIPQSLAGGGEGETSAVVSVEASSIYGALQLGNTFTSRELTLIHNRAIIISEELAKEGLKKYLAPLMRSRDIRRNTFVMITRGKADNLLRENKPFLEKYISEQMELILSSTKITGLSVNSMIGKINEDMKTPGRGTVMALADVTAGENKGEGAQNRREQTIEEVSYLPGEIPRKGGNKTEFIGLAAFSGDKLVGFLNGSESRYYHLVRGELNKAIFTYPDPEEPEKYAVVLDIREGRNPEYKADLSGEKARIEVDLHLEAEIVSIESGINYEMGEKQLELQKYLEDLISREVMKVIKKSQDEFASDILGFDETVRQDFWTWQDWENYDWSSRYPEAEITVKTNLDFRRPGLMGRTVEINSKKQGEEQ